MDKRVHAKILYSTYGELGPEVILGSDNFLRRGAKYWAREAALYRMARRIVLKIVGSISEDPKGWGIRVGYFNENIPKRDIIT